MSWREASDPPFAYAVKLGEEVNVVVANSTLEAIALWTRWMDAKDAIDGDDWRSSEGADEPDSVSKLDGWAITEAYVAGREAFAKEETAETVQPEETP